MARRNTRRRRARHFETPAAARPVPPTPETVSKLRQDVIGRLFREGRLREEHVRASKEVREVWEAIGRTLFPTAGAVDGPRQFHLAATARDPIQRMSDAEEAMWRRHYRPWADEMSLPVVTGTVRVSRLQVVLDIAVDNHGLRQVEAWYRMRHGLAFEYLRASLHRYAELAGWVSPDDGPA